MQLERTENVMKTIKIIKIENEESLKIESLKTGLIFEIDPDKETATILVEERAPSSINYMTIQIEIMPALTKKVANAILELNEELSEIIINNCKKGRDRGRTVMQVYGKGEDAYEELENWIDTKINGL